VKNIINKKMKKIIQKPKGMHDILPDDWQYWEKIIEVFKDFKRRYNFGSIETPVLEPLNLFEIALSKQGDLMSKEVYTLKTKSGENLILRPEGTISTARAYVENSLNYKGLPQRLAYFEPMFRHENPQAGRYREFHQIGFEIIGGDDPFYDYEIINLLINFLKELKIKNISLKVNSIGCHTCQPKYERQLKKYFSENKSKLCHNCQKKYDKNPLRVLDCKDESCQTVREEAPNILDYLCASCRNHFKSVLEYLDEGGVEFTLDKNLVRGLDYYNRTVFEIFSGSDQAIVGGGRYDYLIKKIGGKNTPAVGGGIGVERLIELMKSQNITGEQEKGKRIFFIHIGDIAKKKSIPIINEIRKRNISIFSEPSKDSLKSQLKLANKKNIPIVLIYGQKEVFEESIIIRNLKTGIQENVPLKKLVDKLKDYL